MYYLMSVNTTVITTTTNNNSTCQIQGLYPRHYDKPLKYSIPFKRFSPLKWLMYFFSLTAGSLRLMEVKLLVLGQTAYVFQS